MHAEMTKSDLVYSSKSSLNVDDTISSFFFPGARHLTKRQLIESTFQRTDIWSNATIDRIDT